MGQKSRADIRQGVHSRIRKKVKGTAERPRLAVFRSLNHIYAQIIDDKKAAKRWRRLRRLKSAGLKTWRQCGGGQESIRQGDRRACFRKAGIETVVFDRGGYVYHGRVKASTTLHARRDLISTKQR